MSVAAASETETNRLPRVLGPVAALCVVVGSVIGSGIFLVPAAVADGVPFLGGIVSVWIVGGVLSAAGALTLAELGAMMPHAGGPYVYLRAAYGNLPAFLFGWAEFWVVRAGSMATLAAAFARYCAQIVEAPGGMAPALWQMILAIVAIGVVTAVNVAGTRFGGGLQVAGTALKLGAVSGLILLPWLVGGVDFGRLSPIWPDEIPRSFAKGFLAAMVGVLWAYDGWVNLTPLAEEVRDPERNLPRSLIAGMAILIAVYLTMTVMYHLVLPLDEVRGLAGEKAATKAVAAEYCLRLVGVWGVTAISLVVMGSTFISLNGNALTGPRAYFALARDGLFPASLAQVHRRFGTPAAAILAQSGWAIVLTVAGTALVLTPPPKDGLPTWLLSAWSVLNLKPLYDLLYTYVIFGATLFYVMAIASVFILRARRPDLPRPYHTWGYPYTPILYVVVSILLLVNMLAEAPFESIAGLGLIAAGIPVYQAFYRTERLSTDLE